MKKYKIKEDFSQPDPYGVYRRHHLFFWRFLKAYKSQEKARSAMRMFEFNGRKK